MGMSGDDSLRRFDIVAETRRRWSREDKLSIVAEASGSGTNISAVARRHGIKPALLYRWKKELASEKSSQSTPAFVPVTIGSKGNNGDQNNSTAVAPGHVRGANYADGIEIMLANGRCVRVRSSIEPLALKRIIDVLEG